MQRPSPAAGSADAQVISAFLTIIQFHSLFWGLSDPADFEQTLLFFSPSSARSTQLQMWLQYVNLAADVGKALLST